MLAVNRRYGRADYLPCIAWGGLARRCGALEVGDGVRIEGRLQSRAYTKVDHGVSEVRTAYEVSVMKLGVEKKKGGGGAPPPPFGLFAFVVTKKQVDKGVGFLLK